MKTAAIISVGTEIMRGKIDDTNSTFLSRFLKDCGIRVKFRLSTEDEIEDIVSAIRFVEKSDLIILTGGLGPTADDLTREALAKFLGGKLIFQESQWRIILERFKRFNWPVAPTNKQQADLIEGGEFIPNPNGTAPGMTCRQGETLFVLIPGPPRENVPMISGELRPILLKNGLIDGEIFTKIVRVYNAGESLIADLFKNFREDIQLGYYFSAHGWVEIHFSKFIHDKGEIPGILALCEKGLKILEENDLLYTEDKDLSRIVLDALLSKKKTVSFAESITGGNLSAELVKHPGASNVFTGGIVSYSNAMKVHLLEVQGTTLEKFGAVSEQTVREMAYGLKKKTASDMCIAVSGIAGPDGGSKEKPVGLVYMGFLFGDEFVGKKEIFGGTRRQIINQCVNFIFAEMATALSYRYSNPAEPDKVP
jgi:nicotinamide-nucleotide amidase